MNIIEQKRQAARENLRLAQAEVDRWDAIAQLLDNPDNVDVLRQALSAPSSALPVTERVTVSGGISAFDKLCSWFADNNNKLATVAEMAGIAKVSVSAIRQIVYVTRKEAFSKHRGDGKESQFQLTVSEYAKKVGSV